VVTFAYLLEVGGGTKEGRTGYEEGEKGEMEDRLEKIKMSQVLKNWASPGNAIS
jgi:hypothetical protein